MPAFNRLPRNDQPGIGAGRAFMLLAALFMAVFGVIVVLIALDQQRVVENTRHLQEHTVPEIVRYQRLARNLEQLRQEGERIFSASTAQSRQQAMFVVTLVASHPSILEHKAAAELARQTEQFLADVVRQAAQDESSLGRSYETWQRLAARIGLQADDVAVQGISLANVDLDAVSEAIRLARYKLIGALIVVGSFLFAFLILVRRHLIKPLQRIDRALSSLSVEQPAPAFGTSMMSEIHAVELAIGELHASLVQNESARLALETLANRDGLTGLMNRRYFLPQAETELQRAQRYRRPVCVAMADLDFFKKLNDSYGHAAGDAVLRAFSTLVQETLRQSDLICRYGGEEFAFVFPESTLAEATRLAERLRERCADYDIRLPDQQLIRVTVSIGVAEAGEGDIDAALHQADEALYKAKDLGRNRVVAAGQPIDQAGGEPRQRAPRSS